MPRLSLAPLMLVAACRATPEPCISGGTCGEGRECLANYCTILGGDPTAQATERHLLLPTAAAVIGARRTTTNGGLPLAATLGSRAEGAVTWYLNFAPTWPDTATIDRAFLILSPLPSAPPSRDDLKVTAWRVSESWTPAELTWLGQPAREPPRSTGLARSAPPQVMRLDVTRIVQHWQEHPHDRHGIAIETAANEGHGVSFSTGAGRGRGPQLETYILTEAE